MKLALTIIFTISLFISCKGKVEYKKVTNKTYSLFKPNTKPKAVLILFGGYPEVADDIEREFKILESARSNAIAVCFSNYNQKLWLENKEKELLAEQIKNTFLENQIPKDNVYFGGFSSGGNVALLIANYLTEKKEYQINPKGIVIIDSPVDLTELYFSAEKNIARNFSEVAVQESNWIIKTLGNRFGHPNGNISSYEKHSVYTGKTSHIENLKNLKDTKIRIYTEPDTLWWKKNRMADYEQTNAYQLKKLSKVLNEENFKFIEYRPSENRGYRSNGERHPHSWSIVEPNELINWMLNK